MPGRSAVSGNVSPETQDNINVAMPKPTTPPGRAQSTSSRPKRKISRPARYSDYVFEPPTKKRASTASIMSSLKSTPTPTRSRPVLTDSTIPIKQSESEPEDSDNVFRPAGYSAGFLTNFIEDHSPSDELQSLPASDAQQDPTSELNGQLTSDVVPDSVSGFKLPSDSTGGAPHESFTEHNPQIISSTAIPTQAQPRQLDSPDQIINKLQVACHALSNLNIPPVPNSAHSQSPQQAHQQPSAPPPESGSSDLASNKNVHFLLDAAAGSDSSEPKDSSGQSPNIGVGDSDEDLLFLIHNAIQILHNYVVSKNHLQGRAEYLATGKPSKARGGGRKRSDVEGFAISALQQLFDGGATNINCFISKERSHLMRHLYTQLQYIVMAPQYALPRQYHFLPQTVNGMMATHPMGPPVMGLPMMMQQHQPPVIMPRQNDIPPPHQFLGRHNPGQYISPYPMNPILMDQSKLHEHNQTLAHVHMLPDPAMIGRYPGGDMPQHLHPMSSQPPPQYVMMNQSNFPMPYNTFPPAPRQTMYLPTQRLQLPLAPSQNFNLQQVPITSSNDFQSRAPVTPSNFGFSTPMPAPPPQPKSSRGRPKSSGSSQRSERIVAREGNQQPLTSMPANVSVQRVQAPIILGND